MPAARKEELTTVGGLALLASFICFIAAVIFGCVTTVQLSASQGEAPNVASAGAACGFGVASGLALVAAAIAESGARRREPRVPPPTSTPPMFSEPTDTGPTNTGPA